MPQETISEGLQPTEYNKTVKQAEMTLQNLGFDNFEQLRGIRILDVGSGEGEFGQIANDHDVQVVSLDKSIRGLKPDQNNPQIQATAQKLPFKDNSFDLVVSHCSAHNISRLSDSMVSVNEYLRVVSQNGKVRLYPPVVNQFLVERFLNQKRLSQEDFNNGDIIDEFTEYKSSLSDGEQLAITIDGLNRHNIKYKLFEDKPDVLELSK